MDLFQLFVANKQTMLSLKTGIEHPNRPFYCLFFTDSWGRNFQNWLHTFPLQHLKWDPNSKHQNCDFIWTPGAAPGGGTGGATLNRPPSTQTGYKHNPKCYLFDRCELDPYHAAHLAKLPPSFFKWAGTT